MQLSRHATGGHVPPPSGIVATPLAPQTPSPRTAPGCRPSLLPPFGQYREKRESMRQRDRMRIVGFVAAAFATEHVNRQSW